MRNFMIPFTAILAGVLLLAGCTNRASTSRPWSPKDDATALWITDDSGKLSPAEVQARRTEIVRYLVSRGYVTDELAFVDNPAHASRIIRVVLSRAGGFSIAVFSLGDSYRGVVAGIPVHQTTSHYYDSSLYYRYYDTPHHGAPSYSPARPVTPVDPTLRPDNPREIPRVDAPRRRGDYPRDNAPRIPRETTEIPASRPTTPPPPSVPAPEPRAESPRTEPEPRLPTHVRPIEPDDR